MLHTFLENVRHNLFKPLLLFFYMGFLVPILGVEFEFPHVLYQGLTIYLLVSIGWHGGEELAKLDSRVMTQALEFMGVGFVTNFLIGIFAYIALRSFTKLRQVNAATVAGYYGSDSAGTFATCVGVLGGLVKAGQLEYKEAAYMPVMLAIMEIPGCLVALFLVSRLRASGMDALGFMPGEVGYDKDAVAPTPEGAEADQVSNSHGNRVVGNGDEFENPKPPGIFSPKLLHEVFFNPGLFLLFGGIIIGFIGRLQGESVVAVNDPVFIALFQGMLCLFLLEMGMTASRKLKDLKRGGAPFIAFGILAPIVFSTFGMLVAHGFSHVIKQEFTLGTYVLFSVLCGASSYIAVPAVQRLAIPEASPTLPLAASLGLTFSFNVTLGIPIYIEIAKLLKQHLPV